MHHPWRRLRALGARVELFFTDLPEGLLGHTDHDCGHILIDRSLSQAERRCTLAHELEHLDRGPVPDGLVEREELRVRRAAARTMLPDVRAAGDALAWSQCLHEAAEELWVDVATLEDRLRWLHPAEKGYLDRRLC